jgi:hypothetical protein
MMTLQDASLRASSFETGISVRRSNSIPVEKLLEQEKTETDAGKLNRLFSYNEKVLELESKQEEAKGWLQGNYSIVIRSFRSFALFLALEAIAWFLLRQYRFAINDFKQLFRMYTRRETHYLAFKVAEAGAVTSNPALAGIAATMLQEDYTGRLAKDETTEELEERKLVEENPVTSLWKGILDKFPSPAKAKPPP